MMQDVKEVLSRVNGDGEIDRLTGCDVSIVKGPDGFLDGVRVNISSVEGKSLLDLTTIVQGAVDLADHIRLLANLGGGDPTPEPLVFVSGESKISVYRVWRRIHFRASDGETNIPMLMAKQLADDLEKASAQIIKNSGAVAFINRGRHVRG